MPTRPSRLRLTALGAAALTVAAACSSPAPASAPPLLGTVTATGTPIPSGTPAPSPSEAPTTSTTPTSPAATETAAVTQPSPSPAAPSGTAIESSAPTASASGSPAAASVAQVTTSGDVEATLTLAFDEATSSFPSGDGSHTLYWRDEADNLLLLTLDVTGSEVDAFLAVGVPGSSVEDETYFPDFVRTQCEVDVTAADEANVEGSFSCSQLTNLDETMTIDASGTFSASPDGSPEPSPSAGPTGSAAQGTAEFTVTGDVSTTLTLTYDASISAFPEDDGSWMMNWRDEAGNLLFMTVDVAGGAVTSSFLAFGVPGSSVDDEDYFPDFLRTICQLRVTQLEESEFAGAFSCEGLENAAGTKTVDVTGAFSAVP